MLEWLRRLTGYRSSRETALNRLHSVVVYDRAGISPGMMEQMKGELVAVIARYLEIDREKVQVQLSENRKDQHLTADVPVLGARSGSKQPGGGPGIPPRGTASSIGPRRTFQPPARGRSRR